MDTGSGKTATDKWNQAEDLYPLRAKCYDR